VALTGLQRAPLGLLDGTKEVARGACLAADARGVKGDARRQRRRLLRFERRCRCLALIGRQLPDGSPAGGEGERDLGAGQRGGPGASAACKRGGRRTVGGQQLLALGTMRGCEAGGAGIVVGGRRGRSDAVQPGAQAGLVEAHEPGALVPKGAMDLAMLALKPLEQARSLAVVALAQVRDDNAGHTASPGAKIGKACFRAPEISGPGRAGLAALDAREHLTLCG
jgi:hypothetical protein